jgi:nucleoside-diphosphate-sugar epimerase
MIAADPLAIVTGAGGWLGRGLLAALSARRVRALVVSAQEQRQVGADSVEAMVGDLRSQRDCAALCAGARGATLFHCAGVVHPRRVRDFFDVNLTGTENLLRAAASAGVRRAVIVSSSAPIGVNPRRDHVFDERSPYRPYMGYGRSKMLMEQAVRRAQQRGGLETVILRPPWFYGPHQPARQTLFFQMIRDGKGPVVGDGENLRSMAYIDNLCQGLLLAEAKPEASGQTYWIADERPYTMNQVLDTVERLLEEEFSIPCAHRRLRLPGVASQIAWLADVSIQKLGLYHQKIHVLSELNKNIVCTIEKAKQELGYRPQVALEEGMRRSIRWCIEQGVLGPT